MAGIENLAILSSPDSHLVPQHNLEIEKPSERCGIVGIRTYEPTQHFESLIKAGIGVQHRGQLGAGIRIVQENNESFAYTGNGLIREVFTREIVKDLDLHDKRGKLSGYHGRYGTDGNWGEGNLQPCLAKGWSDGEDIAVFHNGQFVDIDGMRREAGAEFEEGVSDTRLFTEMLARAEGKDWDERVLNTLDKVNGAYNLIIHIGDKMYVARDQFGLHPLVMGKIKFPNTTGVIVASETSALNEAGAQYERYVRRGEVFKVDDWGITELRKGEEEDSDNGAKECAFELAYFARSDSLDPREEAYAIFREKCGEIVGERLKIPNASFVIGLPDSGTDMAFGYSHTSGIPLRNYIKRNHFSPNGNSRAFQADYDIPGIRSIVAKKLLYVPGPHWKNAVAVVVDDSAVRGSGSSEVTSKLFELGVSEVHWVFGLPPVKHPCHLAISMRTYEELIANQGDVAKLIGATSARNITPDEFIRAAKGEEMVTPRDQSTIFLKNGMCGGCLTGVHPISKEGVVWKSREPEFVRV